MLKNKIKIIALITLMIISLLIPVVKAENEVEATTTDQVNPISENGNQETITIKDGDEYLFQENVTIDYPVDGNLFIFANNVTINSQIGGDAFIVANSINIEENGYILSNLFACSNNINVKGSVYNIYSVGDTLTIDGFIYRDIKTVCNSLNINGMIGRNAFVNCSNINFKEKPNTEETPSITSYGSIQGDLNYLSDEEKNIPKGAVSGETHFTSLKNSNNNLNLSDYIYSLGAVLVSAVILWLISLWIAPKISHSPLAPMKLKKALQIIGFGILVPLVLTLLSIIILFIPIITQFTILLFCVLAALFFVSTFVTIININDMICNQLKISQNLHKLGFLIITAFIFWLLTFIPYIGTGISILAIIWGIGSLSYSIFMKEKFDDNIIVNNPKEKEVEAKKENEVNETTNVKKEDKSNKTANKEKEQKNTDKSNKSKKEEK